MIATSFERYVITGELGIEPVNECAGRLIVRGRFLRSFVRCGVGCHASSRMVGRLSTRRVCLHIAWAQVQKRQSGWTERASVEMGNVVGLF